MKVKSIYIAISIVLLTMTFASCNEETLYDGPCKVRFVASVQDEVNVTRATEDEKYPGYTPFTPTDFNAELFVSYETETPGVTPTAPEYTISWEGSALSTPLALETGEYKFYGYAPHLEGSTFDNTTKTLTIPNIPGLFDKDLLVINPCSATVTSAELLRGTKTVSLQMDHLMAKITPYFYIYEPYNGLRDIEIKSVVFSLADANTYTVSQQTTDDGQQTKYSQQTTDERLAPLGRESKESKESREGQQTTDNGQRTGAFWVEEEATSSETTVTVFSDNSEAITFLTTPASTEEAQPYGQCYVVPGQDITLLKMTVTYNVYDKKGDIVRPDETATNKVVVKVNSTTKTKLEAGKNYKLNIQIIPTYLYVLSDNDESSVLVIPNN